MGNPSPPQECEGWGRGCQASCLPPSLGSTSPPTPKRGFRLQEPTVCYSSPEVRPPGAHRHLGELAWMRMAATLSHGRKQATGPGQSGSELGGGRAGLSCGQACHPRNPREAGGTGRGGPRLMVQPSPWPTWPGTPSLFCIKCLPPGSLRVTETYFLVKKKIQLS